MASLFQAPPAGLPADLRNRQRLSLGEIHRHGGALLEQDAPGALRIAIAGSGTTDMLARAIAVACAQEGLSARVWQAPFGTWQQQLLATDSTLIRFAPDLVVLATDWRDAVVDLPLSADAAIVAAAVRDKVDTFRQAWSAVGERGARVIHHLPGDVPYRWSGIAERRLPASAASQLAAVRAALLDADPAIVFVDMAPLGWDARDWYSARLQFPLERLPDYLVAMRGALRVATARAKKVLALDLDNTLWGGVIGDDGIDGIALGPGSPAGEAFADFQAFCRGLAERGVILAACSKNDPAIARQAFGHPHAQLAVDDFAAFECSWDTKVTGLRRIAATLNLATDAIVFADDNPVECDLVGQAMPEVAVVHLGSDPADFIARLEQGHWFAAQRVTCDDLGRATAYATRGRAVNAVAAYTDLPGFLASLAMIGNVFEARGESLNRIVQLEEKTNQFNLTTRRYGQTAIRDFAARQDAIVLGATLRDRFGAHGLVAALIGEVEGDALTIGNWVMSCRVFSRTFEHFVMNALVELARGRGLARIVGRFQPSGRNAVVRDLYVKLGFQPLPAEAGWELLLDRTSPLATSIIATTEEMA